MAVVGQWIVTFIDWNCLCYMKFDVIDYFWGVIGQSPLLFYITNLPEALISWVSCAFLSSAKPLNWRASLWISSLPYLISLYLKIIHVTSITEGEVITERGGRYLEGSVPIQIRSMKIYWPAYTEWKLFFIGIAHSPIALLIVSVYFCKWRCPGSTSFSLLLCCCFHLVEKYFKWISVYMQMCVVSAVI